jgi:hypothetical protein
VLTRAYPMMATATAVSFPHGAYGAGIQGLPDGDEVVLQTHRLVGIELTDARQFSEPVLRFCEHLRAFGVRVFRSVGDVVDVRVGWRCFRHADNSYQRLDVSPVANESRPVVGTEQGRLPQQ